jgi:hypothetical protein
MPSASHIEMALRLDIARELAMEIPHMYPMMLKEVIGTG